MNDKKITIITIGSMMVSLLLITIGLSFAYFTANITGTENSTTINVTGGVMTIHYDSAGQEINAPNIKPDDNPFGTKTFTLTGTNTTSNNMEYHILLIVEENTFTDEALKYKLTSTNTDDNGEVAPSIEELKGIPTGDNQEIFLGNAHFSSPTEGSKVHTYNLELYFPDTGVPQDEDQGKIFKAYIDIKEGNKDLSFNEEKGVNHPVLFTGMKPVIWDGEEFTETTEDDPAWYDYDNKIWANAKSGDGSYWVWIPRYAYKITSGYNSSETGTIDVKFLKGRTNEPVDDTVIETEGYDPNGKNTSTHYFLHPAFQFNGDELGFWMAKYEASAHEGLSSGITSGSCDSLDNVSTKSPKIVPNVRSWRCINISNAFKASLAMKDNPIYGWNSIEVDTHMLTNLEWGAVAYLSKSKYGAHTNEVWNNSFTGFQTGCSGSSVSAASEGTCVTYETTNGQKASTTHNIYGVYDMAGGAWDRVMGNYNGLIGSSGFTLEEFSLINSRHINHYYTALEDLHNGYGVDYDLTVYGDAIHETSNNAYRYSPDGSTGTTSGAWHSDYSYLPYVASSPWFARGANWSSGSSAGVFAFSYTNGAAIWRYSFRPAAFPVSVP